MRNARMMKLAVLMLWGSAAAMATIVFGNTANDTGNTFFYSANGASELGDQIHLGGTDRSATTAEVQFFNQGSAGTFDAILRLYQVGSPVGAQLGGSFSVTGIATAGGDVLNVTFNSLNLVVPDDLIFTVALNNVSSGVDLGLDMFEPPTIGSSDNTFMIAKQGSSFTQLGTCGQPQPTPCVNTFFELDATTVPEPGSILLTLLALPAFALVRKRLR